MAQYLQSVNQIMSDVLARIDDAVLFGENIDKGSHISGLSRNLRVTGNGRIINVGDCEATHCGLGFGLMMSGVTAVLFAKQLDFMLLGMDHFVNTYNLIRAGCTRGALGAFTVVTVVYDQGLQGPHSSFNALGDMCSMARVPGYTITNAADAEHVLKGQLARPGFRFITLSQRLCGREILDIKALYAAEDSSLFQYSDGDDLTIACFNFSLPQGIELQRMVADRGRSAALFTINQVPSLEVDVLRESVARTGRLVVIDDSKSCNLAGPGVAFESIRGFAASRVAVIRRSVVDFGVSPEVFEPELGNALAEVGL